MPLKYLWLSSVSQMALSKAASSWVAIQKDFLAQKTGPISAQKLARNDIWKGYIICTNYQNRIEKRPVLYCKIPYSVPKSGLKIGPKNGPKTGPKICRSLLNCHPGARGRCVGTPCTPRWCQGRDLQLCVPNLSNFELSFFNKNCHLSEKLILLFLHKLCKILNFWLIESFEFNH